MADKRITTELVVKAVDQYSGMMRNMSGVTGRFASNVRSEMGRLQGMRGPLRLIEDFRRQQTVVRASGEALNAARERVRQLQHAITTTRNPTAQMRREFERARTAADRLEEKHAQNRRTLGGLQGQMRSAGVNTADLAGEQRRLTTALGAANTAFARQAERMQRLKVMQDRITAGRAQMDRALARSANLSFVGNASMATGRRMLAGVSAPIMQAVAFESAMSDVRKVVDFESPAAFRAMSDDIMELSTRIPIAATGLAEIVAAGGQSGIAQDDLARFAEMAAKIGVAFDISAGQSGEAMASIKTAMALDLDQTGSLFDAMNHLSNNSAARADQTLAFLNVAGADGATFGFDSTETLAIGAAMIAAGAGADTAATSFRNMGRALGRGEGATDRQSNAMERLGLRATDVALSMQQDAVGTTMDVMRRLNELPDHLRATAMSDLFGNEARELTKLMNNMQLMPDMLALVADETQYLGSAEAEYAERSKTTANNMQVLRNQTARLGVSIGEVVLPPLNDLLAKSQVFIDKMVTWTKEHPKLTKWLVISGLALGGMAVAGGAMLTAAAGLIGTLSVLRFGLVGLGAVARFAGGGLGGVVGNFGLLRRLPRLQLSRLIAPLRWTARFIGRIPWVRLAGRLALSSLVTPLRWTAGLLPVFGPALARFSGFRTSASAEITGLSRHVATQSAAMSRSLSRARMGALTSGVMMAAALRNVPQDPGDLREFQDGNMRSMEQGFRATPGISHLMTAYEKSFEWMHGYAPPVNAATLPNDPAVRSAAQTVQGYAGRDDLPTRERLDDLRGAGAGLRAEIATLQAEMDAIGAPTDAYDVVGPAFQQAQSQMSARVSDLEAVEQQLAEDEAQAGSLTVALQVLSGTVVAPEISTESIDQALGKVQQLAAQLQSVPSASTGQPSGLGAVQERATGGVFGARPLLVGERGPELYFPNRSGFIATNQQTQRLQRGAQRVGSASMAALAASSLIGVPSALAAGGVPSAKPTTTHVEIGSISITAPSGVSDPEALVALIEARVGERLSATIAASYSD